MTSEIGKSRNLPVREVAERLSLTVQKVRWMIQDGEFPNAFKLGEGNSMYRIPLADVEAFEARMRVAPGGGDE